MRTQKQECEFLRIQAKNKFSKVRGTWIDLLRWVMPHRATWILSQTPGERKNNHIVDPTHILAQRSYVAGFLEGNTSASRPWYRYGSRDQERNDSPAAKAWLQHFTNRTLSYLGSSNFYHAAGNFYYDYSAVNTGAHYFEEKALGAGFFVHTLVPGSYYVINNAYGEAAVLVREFCLNVLALVNRYGKRNKDGRMDWSNFSPNVKKLYEDANYTEMIDVVHIVRENPDYNFLNPDDPENRQWLELTYEVGGGAKHSFSDGIAFSGQGSFNYTGTELYLERITKRRKPFVVGKSTEDFEYGEKGPTQDALGLIKSLNKKAIAKDRAIEQMLAPTLQGPAALRRSYVSNNPNTYIPIDARSAGQQKVESVYAINGQGLGAVIGDVADMRQQVDRIYFADYLLYLSKNPKTRTARETDAIVEEQQRIIGPNLQSLNFSYNNPILEWIADFVLYEDPYLDPPPPELQGQSLKPEMVSIFAQAQKAADLPQMDRYVAMVMNVAQLNPAILDKVDLDKYADLYEDRLYLPSGLNRPQDKVDAKREQAARANERKVAMQETIPAMARAAKDVSQVQQQ